MMLQEDFRSRRAFGGELRRSSLTLRASILGLQGRRTFEMRPPRRATTLVNITALRRAQRHSDTVGGRRDTRISLPTSVFHPSPETFSGGRYCGMPRRAEQPDSIERARPEWFAAFLADRGTRKPSAHTLRAYRQDFDAIATLIAGADAAQCLVMT